MFTTVTEAPGKVFPILTNLPPTLPSFALEQSEPLILLRDEKEERGVLRKYPSGKYYFKTATEAFIKPKGVAWRILAATKNN